MSVTVAQPVRIGDSQWMWSYTSGIADPTFRVWHHGDLIDESERTDALIDSVTEPVVEVFDDTTEPNQVAYPGRAVLQWYSIVGAGWYKIEQFVSGSWTLRDYLQDYGLGWYSWRSDWLDDVTTHQFRVTPMDADRNAGTAVAFSIFICRNPDTPTVALSYASGNLTVASA